MCVCVCMCDVSNANGANGSLYINGDTENICGGFLPCAKSIKNIKTDPFLQ